MSESNRALAARWMREVWNERREATIDELLAETGVGHMEGGDISGPAEFRRVRAALLSALPDLRITIDGTVAEGDDVVVRWSVSATHLGDGLGLPPSGRAARFRGMSWLRFERGRIVEGWDAWNQGALLEQLRGAPAA